MLHQELAYEAVRLGRIDEYFDSFVLGDDALSRGLADGTLAVDTRLRDALRALAAPGDAELPFLLPDRTDRLSFAQPRPREDAIYAGEATVLDQIDGIVRAEKRVDALEDRVASLERGPLHRLRGLVG